MYKQINIAVYDQNIDEIINTVQNIWFDDVVKYEKKKGKSLKRQSKNVKTQAEMDEKSKAELDTIDTYSLGMIFP